ncbi:AAA domain-containing protein, partial [Frankia sp. Cppng1_Ct_nod]|uniref:AAA domain-containing protein n=1 Tax=Frankia sp. Cppng1_Ct_nod TaxID=2897162 RepID=UPI00202566D8
MPSAVLSGSSATLADRCSRLIRFLSDLALSQSEQILDVDAYPTRAWLCDLPSPLEPDVTAGPGEVLLRVPAVTVTPPPDLPDVLVGWVSLADRDDSALDVPPLSPRLGIVDLVDVPEVADAYDAWLPSWREWAVRDRLTARQRGVYDQLYTASQRLSQEGDTLELVLGTGLLTHHMSDGRAIRHPLLTTRVEVAMDRRTGAMVVRVPDDVLTRLEDAALLRAVPDFHSERTSALHERLRESEACPLGESDQTLLAEWPERALGAADGYDPGWRPPRGVGDRPSVCFAPVLLLRPRGRSALLNYYDEMLLALRTDARPPLGLAQLVETLEPAQRLEWLDGQGTTRGNLLGADPLFPLPANPEQAQIIDRLRSDNGVVVEGPPGTGKTHTIANLISALLAQGQRVLVTSQKAQALRVLRDKLPDDMQRLCVSLTDVTRGGSPELAGSIAALAAEKAAHNPRLRAERIERARVMREQALAKRATLTERIRALRESETFEHPEVAPGFAGTLAVIATRLREQADEHGWLPVPVGDAPGLSVQQAHELLGLLRGRTPARSARSSQHLPDLDGFPSTHDLREQIEAEREAARVGAAGRSAVSAALEALDAEGVTKLRTAFDALDDATARLRDMAAGGQDEAWSSRAVADGLARRDESLWQVLAQAGPQAHRVQQALQAVALRAIILPDVSTGETPSAEALLVAARNLRFHLAGGGRLRRAFRSDAQKAAEPILERATVDGVAVTGVDQLDVVVAQLEATALSAALAGQWAHVGVVVDPSLALPIRLARLRDLHRVLDLVFAVLAARDGVTEVLAAGRVRDVPLRTLDDCAALGGALDAVRLRLATQAATAQLDRLAARFAPPGRGGGAPPELAELAAAVRARD